MDEETDINANRRSQYLPLIQRAGGPELEPGGPRFGPLVASRLTFNVGGVVFQTQVGSTKRGANKNLKLSDKHFLSSHYDEARKEYFFDRDPEVFRCVLNYWRSGKLHLPSSMCGPQMKEELEYWGLKEVDIEPCCWNTYNTWMQTMTSLKQLERDRRPAYYTTDSVPDLVPTTRCRRHMASVWNILTDPSYSRAAKVYAYLAIVFVVLAIFSFCASTHPFFHVHPSRDLNSSHLTNTTPYDVTDTPSQHIPHHNNTSTTPTTATRAHQGIHFTGRAAFIHPALVVIDYVCLTFFTIEYLLRLICAPKSWKFVISVIAVIDLLAILPDYIELIVSIVHPEIATPHAIMEFIPLLRLMRAFRIFRLIRRVPGLWIMMYTLKASYKELSLMLMFLLVGTLLFSSVIFFVDDTAVFHSIPHGFWWAIVTMTTVGYGDMTPTTALGQLVGSVTAICGVLIIGFTIPALVNNFITYYNHVEFVVQKEFLLAEQAAIMTSEARQDAASFTFDTDRESSED